MPHKFADYLNIARLPWNWQEYFVDFFEHLILVENTPFQCRPRDT